MDRIWLLLLVLGLLFWDLHRLYLHRAFRRWLKSWRSPARPPKPWVMKTKSELDCPFCRAEEGHPEAEPSGPHPLPWSQCKKRGGRKKQIPTQGFFCPNPKCKYYGITDEGVHALVGDGVHGKRETIQDFYCQACHTKFSARRNTVLYRLKTHSTVVEKVLWLLALGVELSALVEVFGIGEGTLRTWLARSGEHSRKLHEHFLIGLNLVQVQLDELWADIKHEGQALWVWVALDAKTKLIPVLSLSDRTQQAAYQVVHELKARLAPGCIPVFTTDGLKAYFYALTSHFGKWLTVEGKKSPLWVLLDDLIYARVVKLHRRRKLVRVERQVLCGTRETFRL